MKKWVLVFALILSFAITLNTFAYNESTRIEAGMAAPAFSITQLNDVPFTLDGKPTIIWFFSSWCSYMSQMYSEMGHNCDNAASRLKNVYHDYGDQFRWIGISFASAVTRKDVGSYRMKYKIPFALAIDSTRKVWADYGVRYTPTVIIVSKGTVVYRAQGTLEKLEETILLLTR